MGCTDPADTGTKGTNMQPSTHQTAPGASVAGLPAGLLALVVVAGSAGLFATYWDDAWHTDLGRDQATIPPHLLLYAVVAACGLSALRRSRSLAAVLRQPPLLLVAAGGTVTLAALPIDAAWHAAFGRDAVLWSPPHMLAIFGSLALLVGLLGAARPDTSPWILTGLGHCCHRAWARVSPRPTSGGWISMTSRVMAMASTPSLKASSRVVVTIPAVLAPADGPRHRPGLLDRVSSQHAGPVASGQGRGPDG